MNELVFIMSFLLGLLSYNFCKNNWYKIHYRCDICSIKVGVNEESFILRSPKIFHSRCYINNGCKSL